jgi:hypothetical protein
MGVKAIHPYSPYGSPNSTVVFHIQGIVAILESQFEIAIESEVPRFANCVSDFLALDRDTPPTVVAKLDNLLSNHCKAPT